MSRQHHRRKLLGELLKEEQEPFVLDAFLQEKRAAQAARKQQHLDPTTTLGQLLLRRPKREVVAVVSAASQDDGSRDAAPPSCSPTSTCSSSLVSIPRSSRWGPCSSSSSMASLTRHHPLMNKTSSLRLVSPFPEPARRTALCILLEAAAGRAQRKLSKRQRSKTKKRSKSKQCKGSKQRYKQGGSSGGVFVRSLFSSLVKKRKTTNRKEITDGPQQVAVLSTMGDILNWKWNKRGGYKTQQEKDGFGRCVWDEKRGESTSRKKTCVVGHWDEVQSASSPPTTNYSCNGNGIGKEVTESESRRSSSSVHALEYHDEELGGFICSWGYANNVPPASDGCSTSGSTSSAATGTSSTHRHRPSSGSSFSCSTDLSLSSLCDNNRNGDNSDEPGSSSSSSPLHHQQQEEEEEEGADGGEDDGQLLRVAVVSCDDDAVEGAESGPATQSHRASVCEAGVLEEQEHQTTGNDPHGLRSCSCGGAVDKDQLSPVSVLEPAAHFDDDEEDADGHEEEAKISTNTGDEDRIRNSTGRDRDGDDIGRGEYEEDEAAETVVAFRDEEDDGILLDVDQSRFQRSLTIVLESRNQILKKLKRFERLAAVAAGIEPVNLDETFAASHEEQSTDDYDDVDIDQHLCCVSEYNADENEAEDSRSSYNNDEHHQLQHADIPLRPCCSWINHEHDAATTSGQAHDRYDDAVNSCTTCDAQLATEEAGFNFKQLVINGKFIVSACWDDAADTVTRTGTTTTIDMMVEEDLRMEGNTAYGQEWRGGGEDLVAEVVTGIEASIFTLLINEFYSDMYSTPAHMQATCY